MTTVDASVPDEAVELKCLEFFSGIGGYRFAFQNLTVPIQILDSFDINELANSVYKSTFNCTPNNRSITNLSLNQIQAYRSDIWCCSPPCQPFTRGGLRYDELDERSLPFLHLLNLLDQLTVQPRYLVVENVFPFEKSNTRKVLVETLYRCGYVIEEFVLNTVQFGFTNSRLRYYLLAEKKQNLVSPAPSLPELVNLHKLITRWPLDNNLNPTSTSSCSLQLQKLDYFKLETQLQLQQFDQRMQSLGCKRLCEVLDFDTEKERVPVDKKVLERNPTFKLDIVTPNSIRSSCFTKAYGSKHIYTSGSLLNINQTITYFTWEEVAILMGFPIQGDQGVKLKFPSQFTHRQRCQLLGNSFNPKVVACLLEKVFHW